MAKHSIHRVHDVERISSLHRDRVCRNENNNILGGSYLGHTEQSHFNRSERSSGLRVPAAPLG